MLISDWSSDVGAADLAALADTVQRELAARARLCGHQTNPGRKLAPRTEGLRIPHRGNRRRVGQQADPRNLGNRLDSGLFTHPLPKAPFDRSNLRLQAC